MKDIEFVKHRFAGKIKEIINTYKKYYLDKDNNEGNKLYNPLILQNYLLGLLYGTGLQLISINNKGIINHYVIKENTKEKLAEIDFNTNMVKEIENKNK